MPSVSKAQQGAAGAALAAKEGKSSSKKLYGAAKSMFKSMSGEELKKFASTKRKGLPQHVSDSADYIKAMIQEGGHKAGCQCNFCKNYKGKGFGKKADKEDTEDDSNKMTEGRDDINKLPISKEGKAYARRSGLASMKRQPQDYINMVAAETGQKAKQHGFKNFDAQELTGGSAVGSKPLLTKKRNESRAARIVNILLN